MVLLNSPLLNENNELKYETKEKADILGKNFQTVMSSHNIYNYDMEDLRSVDRAANNEERTEYNVLYSRYELEKAIEKLPANKACGKDEIHNQFLKHLPDDRVEDLLGILNRIWRFSQFPDEWKLALIVPILKEGKEPKNPSSYRPISLLSCLSKLMEQMVYTRLVHHIETNNLLRNSVWFQNQKKHH